MRNLWTAKNPRSFWLRAANAAASQARGHATAAITRAQKQMAAATTRAVLDAWAPFTRTGRK